ncbi:hypothetical protein KJY78_05725 [Canibacter sp. lx-45]|uniref:transglutaminase domain-containing protein n=1 Tax=Canibacter zhuwentaonis TaxID=2837491 RepID=UPI001BDBFFEA|nr:transglutaminase domain-containing protein [Canibacter zhuwentaonis]MBT1035842.1 hypothetical protein [Canibacter zhuwentaonis]
MSRKEYLLFAAGGLVIIFSAIFACAPLYANWRIIPLAAVITTVTLVLCALLKAQKISRLLLVGLFFTFFVAVVIPLAVPQVVERLPGSLVHILDGLSAVVTGWKKLLTIDLPAGDYQTVLIPYAVTVFVAALGYALTFIARRAKQHWAALWFAPPVLFSAVFGSSRVSDAAQIFGVHIKAPYESAIWGATALVAVIWVWFFSTRERRQALAYGRAIALGGSTRIVRGVLTGGFTIVAITVVTTLVITTLTGELQRRVARDSVTIPITSANSNNLLKSYRDTKSDARLKSELFSVQGAPENADRLRIAVFNEYNGVNFTVSEKTHFTRLAGGLFNFERRDAELRVRIASDYLQNWLPHTGVITGAPVFDKLGAGHENNRFYRSQSLGTALLVPVGRGMNERVASLQPGDEYTVGITVTNSLTAAKTEEVYELPLTEYPQLQKWLMAQQLGNEITDLEQLFKRLASRGYLSHALTLDGGRSNWLDGVAGLEFVSAAGGHSQARIEQMFERLNSKEQQFSGAGGSVDAGSVGGSDGGSVTGTGSAGAGAGASGTNSSAQLVAAVGDDEQFASAAALLARALGYDSRVVVGARLKTDVPGVPACREGVCRGENIAAWVEVQNKQGEWLSYDVSPQIKDKPISTAVGVKLPEFNTLPPAHTLQKTSPPQNLGADGENALEPHLRYDFVAKLLVILGAIARVLAVILPIALLLLIVPLIKILRWRVRRRGEASVRVLAAWRELVDRALDARVLAPAQLMLPRLKIAEIIGSPGAKVLAEHANLINFAPTDTGADARVPDAVWDILAAELATRRSILGRVRRIKELYTIISLLEMAQKMISRTQEKIRRRWQTALGRSGFSGALSRLSASGRLSAPAVSRRSGALSTHQNLREHKENPARTLSGAKIFQRSSND